MDNRRHFLSACLALWASLTAVLCPAGTDARVYPVEPGRATIVDALARTAPGDTLRLAGGTYIEPDRVKTPHAIVILAADPSDPPVWLTEGSRHLALLHDAVVSGIRFDGRRVARHAIRIQASSPATVEIVDCEFFGLEEDAITDDNHPVGSLTVRRSLFHDIGETAIEFRTRDVLGRLVVDDATFFDIGLYAIHHAGRDVSLSARITNVTIDRCYGGVYLDRIADAYVGASIVTNCSRFGIRATRPATVVEICTHGNRRSFLGVEPGPGCLEANPQYYRPDTGDYSLFPSSPCLVNAARPIGDRRWTGTASRSAWWGWFWTRTGTLALILVVLAGAGVGLYAYAKRQGHRVERAALTAQLQKAQHLETLGGMTGGIAHDLNNMLGVGLGYLDMAHEQKDADRRTSHIEGAIEAVTDATRLLRQLVTFSAGGSLEYRPVDIGAVVEDVARLLRPILPRAVTLKTEIRGSAPVIRGDTTQIHQVLINLCTNAVDAMKSGGELLISLSSEAADHVDLVVRDTGEGMVPEVAARIFEPFFTTKAEGEGTGMGLPVVKGIIVQHGGEIAVDSNPGRGTEFRIRLPRTSAPPTAPERDKPRILVVDDDEEFLTMVRMLLEREGLSVVTYDSEVTAIEAFTRDPQDFDMVVTDYVMPRLSGSELAKKLRHIRPTLPIILVTGYGQYADREGDPDFVERIQKTQVSRRLSSSIRRILDDSETPPQPS